MQILGLPDAPQLITDGIQLPDVVALVHVVEQDFEGLLLQDLVVELAAMLQQPLLLGSDACSSLPSGEGLAQGGEGQLLAGALVVPVSLPDDDEVELPFLEDVLGEDSRTEAHALVVDSEVRGIALGLVG